LNPDVKFVLLTKLLVFSESLFGLVVAMMCNPIRVAEIAGDKLSLWKRIPMTVTSLGSNKQPNVNLHLMRLLHFLVGCLAATPSPVTTFVEWWEPHLYIMS
jgi:hypothetical protein